MKLQLWLFLVSALLSAQNLPTGGDCVSLAKQHYTICYSTQAKVPLWVQNTIQNPNRDATGRTNDFRPDPALPADQQASLADYRRSGFDRGHLAPSGDFAALGKEAVSESFLLTNMAPEWPNLNRKLWRDLEIAVRRLATKKSVQVVTGTVLLTDRTIGKGVQVPTLVWKAAYGGGRMYAYMMPNVKTPAGQWTDYAVTVDHIEELTGLDLFPGIEQPRQEELERESNRLP